MINRAIEVKEEEINGIEEQYRKTNKVRELNYKSKKEIEHE